MKSYTIPLKDSSLANTTSESSASGPRVMNRETRGAQTESWTPSKLAEHIRRMADSKAAVAALGEIFIGATSSSSTSARSRERALVCASASASSSSFRNSISEAQLEDQSMERKRTSGSAAIISTLSSSSSSPKSTASGSAFLIALGIGGAEGISECSVEGRFMRAS